MEPTKGGVKGGYSASVCNHSASAPYHQSQHHNQNQQAAVGSDAGRDTSNGHYTGDFSDRDLWPKGLTNVGNTCYANAALQCLLSTALTNALLDPQTVPLFRRYSSNPNLLAMGSGSVDSEDEEDDLVPGGEKSKKKKKEDAAERKEREKRQMQENCEWLTRELTNITEEYVAAARDGGSGRTHHSASSSNYMGWLSQPEPCAEREVNPGKVTRHPDRLSKCLTPYQQEDAHEFLRALLSTLVMNGRNKQLSSLFDGLLESAVTCQSCGRASMTRDRYMDLSLDINSPEVTSLDDALLEYTKTEFLDEDNAVFCSKCKKKRAVTKGLRLATAPSILVCHLKRFAFNQYGRLVRLHKKIDIPHRLHIGEYMSKMNKSRPPPYDLVGLLVHQGQTCASGHYLAYVKKNNRWFKCNDSVVNQVDEATVLNQQAYITMYEVADMRKETCRPHPQPTVHMGCPAAPPFEDEPEILKDDVTQAHTYKSSCDQTRYSASTNSTAAPVERLLRYISRNDGGITKFFSSLCCQDATSFLNEPRTTEVLRRKSTGKSYFSDNSISSEFRRTSSSKGVKVMEVRRKRTDSRAQTAPRQRTQSDDYHLDGQYDGIGSPHTTVPSTKTFAKSPKDQKLTGNPSKRRGRRTSSIRDLESRELPPLPTQRGHHRRAKSSAAPRKRQGYMA